MKLTDLFTRETASETRKMYVVLPSGEISKEFYLEVVSSESTEFRRAEATAKRQAVEYAGIKDEDELSDKQHEVECNMLARCVKGWNLDTKFNHDNVVSLLANSDGNKDRLSRFICNRSHWFAVKPSSSSTGSKSK